MTTKSAGKPGQSARVFRRPHVQMPVDLLEATGNKKSIGYVYMWLWHYAGVDDKAWPSTETLAKKARVNEHDVRLSVRWLAEHGYIVKHERRGMAPVYEVRGESAGARRAINNAEGLPRRSRVTGDGARSNEPRSNERRGFRSFEPQGSAQMSPLTRTREQELTQQPNPPTSPPMSWGDTPQAGPGSGDPVEKRSGRPQRPQEDPSGSIDTQQPPQVASSASQAPLAGDADPSSNPVAEAAAKPKRGRSPAARDPYASKTLPLTAIPGDLLDCQQLLTEWWAVKGRGRTQVAFERACTMLRRYQPEERARMLEAAVVGGWQGLHELKQNPSVSNGKAISYGGQRLTPAMESTLGAMAITRGERPGFSDVFGSHAR